MCGPFFTDRLCCLKVRSCDVQVDEGVALFDELASYRIGSLFGDVIISRSDDSLLSFEAGRFQVFPDFLFDLRREIFLEKGESLYAIFGNPVMGDIGTGVHGDQFCLYQF